MNAEMIANDYEMTPARARAIIAVQHERHAAQAGNVTLAPSTCHESIVDMPALMKLDCSRTA
jgi:hypothetical protein